MKRKFLHYVQLKKPAELTIGTLYHMWIPYAQWVETFGVLQVVFAFKVPSKCAPVYLLENFQPGTERYFKLLNLVYPVEASCSFVFAVNPDEFSLVFGECSVMDSPNGPIVDLASFLPEGTALSELWAEQDDFQCSENKKLAAYNECIDKDESEYDSELPLDDCALNANSEPSSSVRKLGNFYLQPIQPRGLKPGVKYKFGAKKAAVVNGDLLQVVYELSDGEKTCYFLDDITIGSARFDDFLQQLYPADIDSGFVVEFDEGDIVDNLYGSCKLMRDGGKLRIDLSSMDTEIAAASRIAEEQYQRGDDA